MENTKNRFWIKGDLGGNALINLDDRSLVMTVKSGKKPDLPKTVVIKNEKAHELHAWLTDQLGLGWVSVEDRLPERMKAGVDYNFSIPVLVYSKKTDLVYVAYWNYVVEEWTIECECNAASVAENVTHWMPITQPEAK